MKLKGELTTKSLKNARQSILKWIAIIHPFYYSPDEIEYFSANSGFSDDEEQENNDSRMAKAVAALEATLKKKREEPKKVKQNVNYYVDPYEPPMPFPKQLEHHAEAAMVHQTMESLKKIKINRPLLKEIRQTDNYAKQMKYLVENKHRTEKDNEIRMNLRCSVLLQDHLPLKEQDPRRTKLAFKQKTRDLDKKCSIQGDYGVTPPKDYAVTYSNEEISHNTLLWRNVSPRLCRNIQIYKDDVSDSALQRNIGDKVTPPPPAHSASLTTTTSLTVLRGEPNLLGNMMNKVDIENLTIEQYIMLTQEKQTHGMIRTESDRMITKNIDDMTIAKYMEYKAEMRRDP
ncbi:hypothetical protein Tco_1163491 [Tanacetum coccineum]